MRKFRTVLMTFVLATVFAGCGRVGNDLESLKKAGLAALEKGENKKAAEYLYRGMKLAPSDKDILTGLGLYYKKEGISDSALSYFGRANKLYPRDRQINRELLELYLAGPDSSNALSPIAVLVATGDNEKLYWPLLAEIHMQDQNLPEAAKYYRYLMMEYPTDPSNYLKLSVVLTRVGNFADANEVLNAAIGQFGPAPEAYANMGINYLNLKEYGKAEESIRKSLELNPQSGVVWISLANVLSDRPERAKQEEALEIYRRYRGQAPESMRLDSMIMVLEKRLQ